MFPIALGFYPIWFAQSSTPLSINKKFQCCVVYLFLLCNWESKEVLLLGGMPTASKKIADGPINVDPFKTLRKVVSAPMI
jgi:hypothetical protein